MICDECGGTDFAVENDTFYVCTGCGLQKEDVYYEPIETNKFNSSDHNFARRHFQYTRTEYFNRKLNQLQGLEYFNIDPKDLNILQTMHNNNNLFIITNLICFCFTQFLIFAASKGGPVA